MNSEQTKKSAYFHSFYIVEVLRILIINYRDISSTEFKYASISSITDSTQPSSNGEISPASFTSFVKDIEPPKRHR